MKNLRTFFLSGSIVLTIIVLIIAFQNIQAMCNFVTFFFFSVDSGTSPTIMIFVVALLGILTGMMYMGLMMSFLSKEEDDGEF
ncbi:hypothetical protein ACFL3T_05010 [Patescibacteria group bacterium]